MSIKLNFAKTFAYAAFAAFLPVAAHAADKATFAAGGTSYEYTTRVVNGHTVISGKTSDGQAFRLHVGDTVVVGEFGGQPVRFQRAEARGTEVAVR